MGTTATRTPTPTPPLPGRDRVMKIICVGRNYAEHAAEIGDPLPPSPLLFGKFENALIGPGDPIVLPRETSHVDAEAELCVEIGVGGKRIAEADALDHIRGYRCANDLSARDIQYSESQWTRAKGFDTFCPLGEECVPVSALGDGSGLRVIQRLNGEVLQDGNTHDMIFSVPYLVAYISNTFTLEPGDLILTGRRAWAGHGIRRCRSSRATSSRSRSRASACCGTRSRPNDRA